MTSQIITTMENTKMEINNNEQFDINNDQFIETPWSIIETYFKDKHLERLVRHQLESYNNFVGCQLNKTIEMFNPVQVASEQDYDSKTGKFSFEMFITFENFHIYRPQIHENNGAIKLMFPQEARLRNFTYSAAMTLDINIKYIVRSGENLENAQTFYKNLPKIHIGKLPIMLKSNICVLNQYKYIDHAHTGECKFDSGGYFIINGSEKTVLGQERAAENKIYCFNVSKNNTKYSWIAEVKSIPDFKCISPKQINMMVSSKNNGFGFPLSIQIPRVKQAIPLFIVFRALGVISDKEICEKILLDINHENHKDMMSMLQASIIDANKFLSEEESVKYITGFVMYTPINMDRETGARKKQEFALDILRNDLFPHCATTEQKIYFMGYMANKLMKAFFEINDQDDRDSYVNKRIDLTGASLNNLFRNYFNKLVKDMEKQIIKEINTGSWRSTDDYENIINQTNIYKIIKSTTIENGFKRALSTGDFGIKHTNSNKVGVAQVLNRLTYVSSLSHLRRISTPTDKSGKLIPPRKLHNTTWGFLCPAETPEGQSVGIVKNLSYMSHVTINSNSSALYEYILPEIIKVQDLQPIDLFDKVKVFINGTWVGITEEPLKLYNDLKEKKYKGIINIYASIVFDYKNQEIRVCNDGGRIMRPLLRVKDNNILLTKTIKKQLENGELSWDDLFTDCKIGEAILEYVDPEEQSFSMISVKPHEMSLTKQTDKLYRYTHCELHPSTIFGVLASCIPFPEHNQSPRNTYQCLGPDEHVWMADGTKKAIKDVKIGDSVKTFHPETFEITETTVVNQFVRPNEYPIYKLTTVSGRTITATEDHKFMTNFGWATVGQMRDDPRIKVGIAMSDYSIEEVKIENPQLILNEEMFINKMRELNVDETSNRKVNKIFKYVEKLKECGLLPLYEGNPLLPTLSRIIGFLYADGSINIYSKNRDGKYKYKEFQCAFDFGKRNDGVAFDNDVYKCGFKKVKIMEGTRSFMHPDDNRLQIHHTFTCIYNGCFPAFLISLGLGYGKKTETPRNPIAQWIMNTKEYARQFLKGFQGGDGCKIRWNPDSSIKIGLTSQQINPRYTDSMMHFMKQCVEILHMFDINVTCFKTPEIKSCKINADRDRISFTISSIKENLINYFNNIGYAYSETKNNLSFIVIEYLKSKLMTKQNNFINIEHWIHDVVEEKNGFVFVPLESITLEPDGLISDIEVLSENHSFISTNNFASMNCAMGKQAMGVYVTNYLERMDKTAYVLNYPTRPLVDTRVMNMIKLNEIPSGCNINVAIMTHTGYNQEDSLLVNQGSIDRGLFQATIYHTEKDEDKQKINGDEEIRCKPDASKTKGMKFGNYNKVNSKGVMPENTLVENRDIIISKVTPIKENRNDHTKVIKYEDQSKIYRTAEEVYIDKNYIDRNGDGYSFAKVRLRAVRKPVIGDKFSSRHGQKGTVGNIIPEQDMPFTSNGTRPDIIINPHAIPSRMTIGQLKETLLGKVLVELGLFGDGTSFGEFDIKTISEKLLNLGYEANGNEILYNGLTGEQIECNVFMGPVFYQRLKHMVSDKAHSRSIGPMVNLTRQPAEGRSRDGGLRFGEMERDCESSGTPLSLSCGLSVKIETMEFCDHEVLGWSESRDGMIKSKQIGFMNKGEKECVQLTFEDGRTKICTPEHPVLTSNNEWVKADKLVVNETKVKASVTCPVIDIQEEMNECSGWSFQVGKIMLTTNTRQEYLKTLAFMRIIGYLVTDGGIYVNKNFISAQINLGHLIDVETCLNDLRLFCEISQNTFMVKNYYSVRLPQQFLENILTIEGIQTGAKISQTAQLPAFILADNCPRPIVREFLGGVFGGDGHTCYLGMHRGKRDLLTSISISKSKSAEHVESLQKMMFDIQKLLAKCGIHKTTIQNAKETTSSKKKMDKTKSNSYQMLLHIDIDDLVTFSEKIGFRYCCHKSQRLEGGVSYKRLRNEVVRQHNWIVQRVDEITNFSNIKREFPDKNVPTKMAIIQATNELKVLEPLIHEYAIPSTHDITDHLVKGTKFGKFASTKFPSAYEFMEKIGAVEWFLKEEPSHVSDGETSDEMEHVEDVIRYGVSKNKDSLPTMNLKVIDIRPVGLKPVFDIEVEETHSFLANGIVAHNCMISHGAARFTRGRLYDASDKYSVHVCKKCGLIAAYNDKLHIHHCKTCDNRTDFAYVEIPYACKLLFQELITMNVAPRIITDH